MPHTLRRPFPARMQCIALMITVLTLAACAGQTPAPISSTISAANPLPRPPTASPTSAPVESSVPTPIRSAPAAITFVPSVEASVEPSAVLPQQPELAIVRPDKSVVLRHGGQEQQITTLMLTPACDDFAWSPDGYRLALQNGIYTFGAEPSTPPTLSPVNGSDFRWSRDGERLAWLAGVDEHLDMIRVGGPDGDGAIEVGGAHWGSTGLIAWSADNKTVVSGPLQALADGSAFSIIEGRGRNLRGRLMANRLSGPPMPILMQSLLCRWLLIVAGRKEYWER